MERSESCYKSSGKYSEAEAELKRALELNPTDTTARSHLGLMAGDSE